MSKWLIRISLLLPFLCVSTVRQKYILLVSFQPPFSLSIVLSVWPHCITTFVDIFLILTKLHSFHTSRLSKYTKIFKQTLKWFYVNDSTIPMFLKHLRKHSILSCLQFSSFNLIHKDFLNTCFVPIMGKRPFVSNAHAFTGKSLACARLSVSKAFVTEEIKHHLFSVPKDAVKMS